MSQPPPSDQPYPQGGQPPQYPQGGQQPYPEAGQQPHPQGGEPQYPQGGQPQYPDTGQQQYPQGGQQPYPQGAQQPYAQSGQQQFPQEPSPYGQQRSYEPQQQYRPDPTPQPAYQPAYAAQPSRDRTSGPSRRSLWLAALGGFVLAAVIAVVLAVTGVLPGDDSGSVDTSSVALPDSIGSYRTLEAVSQSKNAPRRTVDNTRTSDSRTATALSQANGGAGADVQTYSNASLDDIVSFWVVRADTAQPVVAYEDPAYLGLAQAPISTQTFGDVTCVLQTIEQTPAGQEPPRHSQVASVCQRSEGGLTLQLHAQGSSGTSTDPKAAAALVDQMWGRIS